MLLFFLKFWLFLFICYFTLTLQTTFLNSKSKNPSGADAAVC